MKKRLFLICLSVTVAVVLLAVFVGSCLGTKGDIRVEATVCDAEWQGPLDYTLTQGSEPAINGTVVPFTHSSMATGDWTCAFVSGGRVGVYLESITPSATQSLSGNGTITFTFNFELDRDAAIDFLTWTVNGTPCQSTEYEAAVCDTIDVHFYQWVNACSQKVLAVDETSHLNITQTLGLSPVQIFAVNDWCALNKTPEPPDKLSQVSSFNGTPVEKGMSFVLNPQQPVDLEVETAWQLEGAIHYTKAINWLGLSLGVPEPHPCVLFELVLPGPGLYQFTLIASADAELVDGEDIDPENDHAVGPALILTVNVPP